MPALVRRGNLWQRLETYLDPKEVAIWIAEELNDDKYYDLLDRAAIPIAISLNLLFLSLRNYGAASDDEVFGDSRSSRVYAWLYPVTLHGLFLICCANAAFAFLRKKQYRLLHQPLDQPPTTPSARKVQLDTGHGKELVWEIDVWHPEEFSLTIFTFFSPIHIVLYYAVLPSSKSYALLLGLLGLAMSAQFAAVQSRFARQAQDSRIIHGQVLNEYDKKFVQPMMHRPVRDVAVQAGPQGQWTVDAYSSGLLLNRGTQHLNYTPTSYRTDSGTNTRRSIANGHTPTHSGASTRTPSFLSTQKQRAARPSVDYTTPSFRYSGGETYSLSALPGSNEIEGHENDEIRVATRPSPALSKTKRRSFRPSR